jgi:hypothetical protein
MNDLKDLFELALTDGDTPRSDVLADPSADLARGKKLLARRTRRRMLGAAAGATAAAAAAAVAVGMMPTATPEPSHPAAVSRQHSAAGIRLVAYTGTQPPGYTVKEIPAGWVIQGSNPYALVIAPRNAPNKNPDVFIGKLIVAQEAFDTSGASAQGWAPVHVAGHAAYYSVQSGGGTETAGLVIEEAPGRWLLVQTPTSLGWSKQQMVQFGLGITVLPTAQEGKG